MSSVSNLEISTGENHIPRKAITQLGTAFEYQSQDLGHQCQAEKSFALRTRKKPKVTVPGIVHSLLKADHKCNRCQL